MFNCDDCEDKDILPTCQNIIFQNHDAITALVSVLQNEIVFILEYQRQQIEAIYKGFKKVLRDDIKRHEKIIDSLLQLVLNTIISHVTEHNITIGTLQQIFEAPTVTADNVQLESTDNVGPTDITIARESRIATVPGIVQQNVVQNRPIGNQETPRRTVDQNGGGNVPGRSFLTAIPPPFSSVIAGQPENFGTEGKGERATGQPGFNGQPDTRGIVNNAFATFLESKAGDISYPSDATLDAEATGKKEWFPIDPRQDPIAWKFAPDDQGWRQQSAAFLGADYQALLAAETLDDLQQIIFDIAEAQQ